jgi:hypothetical protein
LLVNFQHQLRTPRGQELEQEQGRKLERVGQSLQPEQEKQGLGHIGHITTIIITIIMGHQRKERSISTSLNVL